MKRTLIAAMLLTSGCAANSGAPVGANAGPEKRIQACIVDTIAPGGMMTVSAIHLTSSNDTMLLQKNGRVPISEAVAGPRVWTKGPVQLTSASGRVNFAPSGKPKAFAPGKIVLLGMHDKVPIFGNPADVTLLNVCSYPSGEPNSDPSDCVFQPNNGFLTIVRGWVSCSRAT